MSSRWFAWDGAEFEKTMEPHRLVHMANAIGEFFEADPDRQAALEGIAGHLKGFWDPRMRRELLHWIDLGQSEGLSPLVLDAIRAHRQTLAPLRD